MGAVMELAKALWTGKTDTYQHHPFNQPHGLENVAEDTWFYKGFSNSIFRDTAEGMVIIDPGSFWDSRLRFEAIRAQIASPLDTAIFTHGHTDHVFGMNHYIDEAKEKNKPLPKAVAHEAMPARFRRYRETLGWNGAINGRQFMGSGSLGAWPEEYNFREITYADRLAARAEVLSKKGDHRLACHLVDWSFKMAPDDAGVKAAVYNVYIARAQAEPSTMAMGIFLSAARESGVETEAAANLVFDLQDKRGQDLVSE